MSASICNAVNDLGGRGVLDIRYSLRDINKLCGYQEGFACKEEKIPLKMGEELRQYHYRWQQRSGPQNSIDLLKKILSNGRNSIPVVGLSSRYFNYLGWKSSGPYPLDHAVVVLGLGENSVYIYDPYEIYLRGRRVEDLKRVIPLAEFLRLWDEAHESRFVCWAEPTTSQRLYDFETAVEEGEHAD